MSDRRDSGFGERASTENVEDARGLMVRAGSMLSLLHHRGYIDYSKPYAPDRYDVERLIGELLRATEAPAPRSGANQKDRGVR